MICLAAGKVESRGGSVSRDERCRKVYTQSGFTFAHPGIYHG